MGGSASIKWRDIDEQRIRDAARAFNRKIRSIERTDPHLAPYQPARVNIKDLIRELKQGNRSDYNIKLNQLHRYLRDGAENLYVTKSGVITTKWQKSEINNMFNAINQRRRSQAKLLSSGYNDIKIRTDLLPRKNTSESIPSGVFNLFVKNLEKQLRESDLQSKAEQYKDNYKKAIYSVYGNDQELLDLVDNLGIESLYNGYYSDPILQIDYIYFEPGQLDEIRNRLYDKLKEMQDNDS